MIQILVKFILLRLPPSYKLLGPKLTPYQKMTSIPIVLAYLGLFQLFPVTYG